MKATSMRIDPILKLFDEDDDITITLVYIRDVSGGRLHEYHVEIDDGVVEILTIVSRDHVQFVAPSGTPLEYTMMGDCIRATDGELLKARVFDVAGLAIHG